MSDNSAYPYVVGIPRLINKQTRDFEKPPTFFLCYGTKSNTASSLEHFATREEAEQAILDYHRGLVESGFLDAADIVPFYGIGIINSESSRQPIGEWHYIELTADDSSHEAGFVISRVDKEDAW